MIAYILQGLTLGFAAGAQPGPFQTYLITQMPESLQRGLYIAGGLFILYLAWSSFQQWRNFDASKDEEVKEQNLWKAATMNFLSPGPYIFWSLVNGPLLLKGLAETPANSIAFMVAFYGMMISLNLALIALVGAASQIGERIRRGLLLFASIALSVFGAYQLWLGIVVR